MMSRLCLLILFLGIVRFGDCGNDVDCSTPSAPGSDKTSMTVGDLFLPGSHKSNCTNNNNKNLEETTTSISSNVHHDRIKASIQKAYTGLAIFPGTKWCGAGNIAKNESDLGRSNETDACCRAHDNCKSDILAGCTLENLINNGHFTRSACICDHAFYDCLAKVGSISSEIIGNTYFNILGPQCYECICPENNCDPKTDPTSCEGNCTKYQWFDNSKFPIFKIMKEKRKQLKNEIEEKRKQLKNEIEEKIKQLQNSFPISMSNPSNHIMF
ncbi:uncharacterized protein LOC114928305 [Nylanderia fulva]|uniref:uncharacterized protein LOC114928305 n=1 Tax=Nylanderia fulva TaxID=613905 RepID=UPI0010FBB3E7|nr:uncharacterized protein LOC114928305 [Nylanderia fulva]